MGLGSVLRNFFGSMLWNWLEKWPGKGTRKRIEARSSKNQTKIIIPFDAIILYRAAEKLTIGTVRHLDDSCF